MKVLEKKVPNVITNNCTDDKHVFFPYTDPSSLLPKKNMFIQPKLKLNDHTDSSILYRKTESEEADTSEEKEPTFKSCSESKQKIIKKGIEEAKNLVNNAPGALKRDMPLIMDGKALKANFGPNADKKKKIIISRYENIKTTLNSKEITCKAKCKKDEATDLCAQAESPGKKIYICPNFGSSTCKPGPTIVHESAHNAGATKDIDKDGKYPPKDSENNAYPFEYFPVDLAKGILEIKLRPRKEIEIKIPGEP